MKIALLGYGKMGKELEQIALERKHEIILKVDDKSFNDDDISKLEKADAALEFSVPDAAFPNIVHCIESGVPVVSGTTGWLEKMEKVKSLCANRNGTFFYSPNFSIGVNILFELNRKLAEMMSTQKNYEPFINEVHHVHKKDKPSGTAIKLAEDIIRSEGLKKNWKVSEVKISENSNVKVGEELIIFSERVDEVPGMHEVKYFSADDEIMISHHAKSRRGFALGAILAAEWLQGRRGVFGMNDMLKL
ncbi:MAG: 4-hydroxy-tetrahydrodipicolinate reductase [Bacteroidia bacterium]|nr:4-hydroxy-tetrahydrodipicolinate reductase [Bacteroidia bacterium]